MWRGARVDPGRRLGRPVSGGAVGAGLGEEGGCAGVRAGPVAAGADAFDLLLA
jgi:hypothetical protein